MRIKHITLSLLALSTVVGYGAHSRQRTKDLPELVVKAQGNKMLHILAYVREYSTMSTYSDTVFMFREKMVDFMLPPKASKSKKGWTNPRILNSQSYYRFTDCYGLDSVSASSRHHFSWADWVGLPNITPILPKVDNRAIATDTVWGKYIPTEIWRKDRYRFDVKINVSSDTVGKKWIPDASGLYRDGVDLDDFKVQYTYDNVLVKYLSPTDLTAYALHIESTGRGYDMFRFNHRTQKIQVSTDAEIYILDREYLSSGEVKKWTARKFDEPIPIIQSPEAGPLPTDIMTLIKRVEQIDETAIRIADKIDPRIGYESPNNNYMIGRRVLNILKRLPLIDAFVTRKGERKTWDSFKNQLRIQMENSIVNDSIHNPDYGQ